MKKLLITSTILITIAGGTSYALTSPEDAGADEKPPIVLQVENHEERITDLEDKTDKTQTQVNQNTADINELQSGTGIEPAPEVETVHTVVNKPNIPDNNPPPEPEPEIDPYTITSVTDTPKSTGHYCFYTLENGKTQGVNTGNTLACYEVGSILPKWLQPK